MSYNKKITTIMNNTFIDNLRGYRGSMILSIQVPVLKITGNTYSGNGDLAVTINNP